MSPRQQPTSSRHKNDGNADSAAEPRAPLTISTRQISPANQQHKDRRQAEGLVQLHRELEVAYCWLVTISTDNITQTNEYRSGVGAHWPFLSDAGRVVQKI